MNAETKKLTNKAALAVFLFESLQKIGVDRRCECCSGPNQNVYHPEGFCPRASNQSNEGAK